MLLVIAAVRLAWEPGGSSGPKLADISVAMEMVMVLLAATSLALFVMSLANRAAAIAAAVMGVATVIAVLAVLHRDAVDLSASNLSHQSSGVIVSLLAGSLIFASGLSLTLILYGTRRRRGSVR